MQFSLFDPPEIAAKPHRRRLQGTIAGPMPAGAELVESGCPACGRTVRYAFVGAEQHGAYDLDGEPHPCGGGVFRTVGGNGESSEPPADGNGGDRNMNRCNRAEQHRPAP